MANHDLAFTPDLDPDSISSDVTGFNGILVSTQIPTRADGSLELATSPCKANAPCKPSRLPWSAPAARLTGSCT